MLGFVPILYFRRFLLPRANIHSQSNLGKSRAAAYQTVSLTERSVRSNFQAFFQLILIGYTTLVRSTTRIIPLTQASVRPGGVCLLPWRWHNSLNQCQTHVQQPVMFLRGSPSPQKHATYFTWAGEGRRSRYWRFDSASFVRFAGKPSFNQVAIGLKRGK